jgi:hypothetical protein
VNGFALLVRITTWRPKAKKNRGQKAADPFAPPRRGTRLVGIVLQKLPQFRWIPSDLAIKMNKSSY